MKIPTAFIFFLFVGKVRAWVDYDLIWSDVKIIEINDTVLTNASMWLTKFNRTTTVMNLELILLMNQYKNVEVGFHAIELVNNRPRDTPILDARIDLCDFLKNRTKTPTYTLINLFYDKVLKYGNFPKLCPFRKGPLYIKEMLFEDDLLPPFWPGDKWKLCVTFYYDNVKIFNGTFTMTVDRTTKLRESLIRKMG